MKKKRSLPDNPGIPIAAAARSRGISADKSELPSYIPVLHPLHNLFSLAPSYSAMLQPFSLCVTYQRYSNLFWIVTRYMVICSWGVCIVSILVADVT